MDHIMEKLTKVALLYMFYALQLSSQGECTTTYVNAFHRNVVNPTLPSDYTSLATSSKGSSPSSQQCMKDCVKDQSCKSTVHDSSNQMCYFYSDAMSAIMSSETSNTLHYTEDICADSAQNRPNHCLPPTPQPMKDCQEYYLYGQTKPGIYDIKPDTSSESFQVWCDFDPDHGWTVIQRRQDGSIGFNQNWAAYKAGFGNIDGEYWIGNDNLHALTQTNQRLSIYMRKWNFEEATANYSTFYVNAESDYYRLTVSGYSGDAEDALAGGTGHSHSGQYFSTHDRDYDSHNSAHCASQHTGGWWFNSCHHAELNGQYCSGTTSNANCAVWAGTWADHSTALHKIILRVTRD